MSPTALGDGFAQVAIDCDLRGGVLAPMLGVRQVMSLGVAGVKSLHKFGWQNAAENQWWFMFNSDVDAVKAAITGDTEERTYFSGEWPPTNTKLKKTRLGMGNSGAGPYPFAWLDGSIPAPTTAPAVSSSGGSDDIEPQTVLYVETFVTTWNEESEPGPASSRVQLKVGGSVALSSLATPPGGAHVIDRRRIWRLSYTGTQQSELQLVVELPVGTTTYDDSTDQLDLGSSIATEGWDAAPDGLKGLTSLANQMIAGFKDFDVYFCVPGAPYAWPVANSQAIDAAIIGIGAYGQSVAVLTDGVPYVGFGGSPEEITLTRAEVPETCSGCESKRGIVSVPGGVFYPTKHGLAMIAPSGATNITEKYLQKAQWAAYAPSSFLGAASAGRYIAFYDNGTVQRGLVLDPNVPGLVETSIYATARHVNKGRLYLAVGGDLVAFEEGDPLPYTWRSKDYVMPTPCNMSVGKVIAEEYPATLKLYADGTLKATKTVTSDNEFTLPTGYMATKWSIQVEGTSRVRRVAVAESSEELSGVLA